MELENYFEDIDYVKIIQGVRYDFMKDTVNIEITKDGKECEFLTFLTHTSADFHHEHKFTRKEILNINRYLLTKLLCFGYLTMRKSRYPKIPIVVAMDTVDLDNSNYPTGRCGKTLFGRAIRYSCRSIELDGRLFDAKDKFAFQNVDEFTDNITIDEIGSKFDYDQLDKSTYTVLVASKPHSNVRTFEKSPSIYVTTNEAPEEISGCENPCFIPLFFSEWYNGEWTPYDEFGHLLFEDWDFRQWQLFHSLVKDCQELYRISKSSGLFNFSHGLTTNNPMYVLPF